MSTVKVLRLPHAQDLPLPAYHSEGASGMDLIAAIDSDAQLWPGKRMMVPTGIRLELPPGFDAQVRPRSGLAFKHGITVLNTPGTVDSDYRGEINVLLVNLGPAPFVVRRGERIAQMVFQRVERVALEEVEFLSSSGRGDGGFGSTG